MMAFVEALLALIGFCTLVAAGSLAGLIWLHGERPPDSPPGPYQDGLRAVARISVMAWQAAQAMHHAAQDSEE
jgi:hypothetical protein